MAKFQHYQHAMIRSATALVHTSTHLSAKKDATNKREMRNQEINRHIQVGGALLAGNARYAVRNTTKDLVEKAQKQLDTARRKDEAAERREVRRQQNQARWEARDQEN